MQESTTNKKPKETEYMNNFLDSQIGNETRIMRVVELKKITISSRTESGISEKISFKVTDDIDRTFDISDAFTLDYKTNEPAIKGIWYSTDKSGNILPGSTLAHVMRHYNVTALKDFVGKQVDIRPDQKNFLVIVGCQMNSESTEKDKTPKEGTFI